MQGKIVSFWLRFFSVVLFTSSCTPLGRVDAWKNTQDEAFTGAAFYTQAAAYGFQQRDSLAIEWLLAGRVPSFLSGFVKVYTRITDSATGNTIRAHYFVSPDYVALGHDRDWARIPLTPMAAQKLADSLGCFLPTRKMVDDIYRQAKVRLEPIPMFAFRDSTPTMYQHHLMIEGQRQGKKGLMAGHKKDVVLSDKLKHDAMPRRVAIYGWHRPDCKPVQPLYAGHADWYVDYSHGIRLIQQTIFVDGRPMHFSDVLKHPVFRRLLCDEAYCDVYRYE